MIPCHKAWPHASSQGIEFSVGPGPGWGIESAWVSPGGGPGARGMSGKRRTLECPQCGGRVRRRDGQRCPCCGYVMDMARISFDCALRHDRWESWRRKLELIHAGVWVLVTAGVVGIVAINPGWIMFGWGIAGSIVQLCWGKMILARLKKR